MSQHARDGGRPSAKRRPNVVLLAVFAVAALALAAVLVTQAGGDDDSGGTSTALEAHAVTVTGTPLEPFAGADDDPAVGEKAPVVTGQSFDGTRVTIGDSGPALVVFVAHWCPHCQREVPYLVSQFADHGMPKGVELFGVATDIDPERPNYPPSKWLAREHWDVPTLADSTDDAAAAAFGLSAYPYFVAIDADGKIAARGSGELDSQALASLLEAARS